MAKITHKHYKHLQIVFPIYKSFTKKDFKFPMKKYKIKRILIIWN